MSNALADPRPDDLPLQSNAQHEDLRSDRRRGHGDLSRVCVDVRSLKTLSWRRGNPPRPCPKVTTRGCSFVQARALKQRQAPWWGRGRVGWEQVRGSGQSVGEDGQSFAVPDRNQSPGNRRMGAAAPNDTAARPAVPSRSWPCIHHEAMVSVGVWFITTARRRTHRVCFARRAHGESESCKSGPPSSSQLRKG